MDMLVKTGRLGIMRDEIAPTLRVFSSLKETDTVMSPQTISTAYDGGEIGKAVSGGRSGR